MAAREIAWKPRSENVLMGKRISRIDGVEKASGHAKYAADINTEGTLYARLLTCKLPHAKVAKLDVEPARKIPGVHAVHVFRDVGAEAHWDGTLIAAVAAERPEIAQDAIRAIEVKYESLPHFVDDDNLEAAIEAGRAKDPRTNEKGNVAEALANAATVHKGYYGIEAITHMCMETHGSHCDWKDDGTLDVHLSTQNVTGTAGQYAGPLGLEESNVSITCEYIGGGFGSKFRIDEWGLACAQLSKEAGRPVRLMLDRATELKSAGNRPSAFAEITVAADADGNIVAWDSHHWGTSGVKGNTVSSSLPYIFDGCENRNRKATGISCNADDARAWRAPNHPQQCALTCTALDDLAAKIGMNSLDLFMKNLDKAPEKLRDVYAGEMKVGAKLIDWQEQWHPHGQGGGDGPIKRGLGMALHTWGGRPNNSAVLLKVHPDGTVSSNQGTQDLGTGTRTVIAIVLAETFGIPLSSVKVVVGHNSDPACGGSGGSTTVGGVSGPNRRAALEALWKIFDLVAAKYEVDAATLSAKDEKIWSGGEEVCTWKQAASLVGVMPLEVLNDAGKQDDGLTDTGVGGVQMADVSVDTETGVVRMNKFVAVQDCGTIIDLKTAESQVEGAVIMGIAFALSEERIMDDHTGRFINADLENYKLPRIGDVGEIVVEMYQPDSEYNRGVVGLGEPPVISPGAAISNAVANAIGVRVPVLPMTPKRVLDALKGGQA